MSEQSVTFSVFIKDHLTPGMDKISKKGNATFVTLRKDFDKLSTESERSGKTIAGVSKELDKLNNHRVRIKVDDSELDKVSKKLTTVHQKAVQTSKGSGKGSGEGMGVLSKLGIAGMAAGAAAGAFMYGGKIMTGWGEAQKADAQLSAGLKSTGGISGKTVAGMSSQADDLEKTTLWEAESTKAGQAMLLTFTQIRGEVFDRAIPAIQDMATRMGTDLPTAALQVGKALNDPIGGVTALRRVGVQMTDQQVSQIKNFVKLGEVSKAQAIILKELETEFGGSASAAGKAGMGGLTILRNKLGQTEDKAGELIYKGLIPMGSAFVDLVQQTVKFSSVNPVTTLMQEKQLFIDLARSAGDSNKTQTQRVEILKQMKQIQPEFLAGLDAESASLDQIKNSLIANVAAYDKRIEYMSKELTIQTQLVDAQKDYSDTLLSMTTNRSKLQAGSFQSESSKTLLAAKTLNVVNSVRGILPKWLSDIQGGAVWDNLSEGIQKKAEGEQRTVTMAAEYNTLMEEAGRQEVWNMKNKEGVRKTAFNSSSILGVEKNANMIYGKAETAKWKQYYIDKALKEYVDPSGTKLGQIPGSPSGSVDAKGLSEIGKGGAPVKQINIYLDQLIGTNNNTFTTGQSPENMKDFMNNFSAALQLILNDVNYGN